MSAEPLGPAAAKRNRVLLVDGSSSAQREQVYRGFFAEDSLLFQRPGEGGHFSHKTIDCEFYTAEIDLEELPGASSFLRADRCRSARYLKKTVERCCEAYRPQLPDFAGVIVVYENIRQLRAILRGLGFLRSASGGGGVVEEEQAGAGDEPAQLHDLYAHAEIRTGTTTTQQLRVAVELVTCEGRPGDGVLSDGWDLFGMDIFGRGGALQQKHFDVCALAGFQYFNSLDRRTTTPTSTTTAGGTKGKGKGRTTTGSKKNRPDLHVALRNHVWPQMEVRPAEHGRDAAARAFWMQAEKSNAEKLREFHRSSWQQEVTTDRKLERLRMRNRVLVIAADELHQRGNLLHGTFFTEDRPVAADIGRDPSRWNLDEVENYLPGFVDNGTAGGFKVAAEELALQKVRSSPPATGVGGEGGGGPHLELLRRKCKSEWCETIVHDVDYGTTRVTGGRGVDIPPARGRSRERRWSGPTSNCAASTAEESGEQKQSQKSISWLDAESLESSAPLPRLFPETDGQFLGVSELRTKYYRAEVEWEIPRGITFKSKAAFQNPRPGSLREWRDRDCVWNYPQEAESTEAVAGVVVFYEKLEQLEWVIEELRSGSYPLGLGSPEGRRAFNLVPHDDERHQQLLQQANPGNDGSTTSSSALPEDCLLLAVHVRGGPSGGTSCGFISEADEERHFDVCLRAGFQRIVYDRVGDRSADGQDRLAEMRRERRTRWCPSPSRRALDRRAWEDAFWKNVWSEMNRCDSSAAAPLLSWGMGDEDKDNDGRSRCTTDAVRELRSSFLCHMWPRMERENAGAAYTENPTRKKENGNNPPLNHADSTPSSLGSESEDDEGKSRRQRRGLSSSSSDDDTDGCRARVLDEDDRNIMKPASSSSRISNTNMNQDQLQSFTFSCPAEERKIVPSLDVSSPAGSGREDKDIEASGKRSPDPIPRKETTSTSTDVTSGENKKERKSAGAASDQAELEAMETLMKQMKDAHMTAKDLPDEQRRERASKLAMKMMDLLDLSDASDDNDDDE